MGRPTASTGDRPSGEGSSVVAQPARRHLARGAVPAALTGASDWQDLTGESRRIGALHGLLDSAG